MQIYIQVRLWFKPKHKVFYNIQQTFFRYKFSLNLYYTTTTMSVLVSLQTSDFTG